jgi:arabinose-5-phosphate isomerase
VSQVASDALVEQAVRVLELEAESIRRVARRVDADALSRAVAICLGCSGKLVLLGTGKSGIVGRKLASTLTSTGTAAVYLHPLDALHGDIGVVAPDDVVFVISKSGESVELLEVIAHVRRRGVPVIGILGDVQSTAAARADVVLDASVDEEACPLNLAPTASTIVAIALGDAIAAILMTAKNFTPTDFAFNHPGGTLGRRLTLRVDDLMHSGPANPVVSESATLMDVLEKITMGGLGAANVVDGAGKLLGIVTDGDVRRTVQRSGFARLAELTAGDVMTRTPTVVTADALAYDALRLMEERPSQIAVLPVVDETGRCVGLLRLHDIVRAGLR